VPTDSSISHSRSQTREALLRSAAESASNVRTDSTKHLKWLPRIQATTVPNTRHSRASGHTQDTRQSTVGNTRHPTDSGFNRPDETAHLNASIDNFAVDVDQSKTDFDQLDEKLQSIYAKWNIEDYINGDDISSIVNALHHNQNNEYFPENLRAINILSAKLLIDNAEKESLDKNFVKSLKLSILYTDLKSSKDEVGVKSLLKHIADKKEQNLFVIEMLSSSDRRSKHSHATGRVITCHPKASADKPLVSINLNKGYIANPIGRGQYTFRMLNEEPSMRALRYPKRDAHSNQSRLSGQSQVVGNCGVIAYKEALQLARAFENPKFKNAFFVRNHFVNPFGGMGSKALKAQFKANYGFGADRQTRAQDTLTELLLDKLKEKSNSDPSGQTKAQVKRVENLRKIHCAQKLDRDASKAGKIPNRRERLRTISPDILRQAGLDPTDGEHLADVKTTKKTGPGITRYLGLSELSRTNSKKVIGALNNLWQKDAGTLDEKANLTKQFIKSSVESAEFQNSKLNLIERLITLDGLNLASPESEKIVKNIIRETVIDQLHRYHDNSTHKVLLKDQRIKTIVGTLVKEGNLKQAQRILRSLVFHRISDHKGPLQVIRRLFTRDPKTVNERNVKAFVEELTHQGSFMTDLKEALSREKGDTQLRHWISLIDHFIEHVCEQFEDPQGDQPGPSAKEQSHALKAEWAPIILHAGVQKLNQSKNSDKEEGIYAINYALGTLNANQEELQEFQELSTALGRSLKEQVGSTFVTAIAMARNCEAAKAAIQRPDLNNPTHQIQREEHHQTLAKKLLVEYQDGGRWKQYNTSWAIGLLMPNAKETFLKGLIVKPDDFQNARSYEKSNVTFAVNQLLRSNSDSAKQIANDFIAMFSHTLIQDFSVQLKAINGEDEETKLNSNYVENLIELSRLSQNLGLQLKIENMISTKQADSLMAPLSDSDNMAQSLFNIRTNLLTTYAQHNHEPQRQREIYGTLIDASQRMIDSGNKELAESGVLRLAILGTHPINIDITEPGKGNKQALIDSLIELFSDPDTSQSARFDSHLLLKQPHIADPVRIAISNKVNTYFIRAFTALADREGNARGARDALELADVLLPSGRAGNSFSDFNETALGKNTPLRTQFFNTIADQMSVLLRDDNRSTQAEGVLRLANLVLPPLSADLALSKAANTDIVLPLLVKIFSDPKTPLATRHNIHLILSAEHVRPRAQQLLGGIADEIFVDALVNYAKHPKNQLGGETSAFDLVSTLNNTKKGQVLANLFADKYTN
jgi:hypothetical protein